MKSTYSESEKTELDYQTAHVFPDFTVCQSELYKAGLLHFLNALLQGDTEVVHDSLTKFIDFSNVIRFQTLEDCHKYLSYINFACHLTLLQTNIHPSHVTKLCISLQEKIDALNEQSAALSMAHEICHKYCLLVKNYSFSSYSKNIRFIMNYIDLHLDEELTLAMLAEKIQKNASTLSATFSKEVGSSITNYIHQKRIQKAIFYFNTTKMSVSEVALAVGIQDFAYFSKLFRKQVGCSPREYCKQLN